MSHCYVSKDFDLEVRSVSLCDFSGLKILLLWPAAPPISNKSVHVTQAHFLFLPVSHGYTNPCRNEPSVKMLRSGKFTRPRVRTAGPQEIPAMT